MRERMDAWGVWRIVFPLLLYYVLSMGLAELLQMLIPALALPENAMWRLTLENGLLLPVFYGIYRRDRRAEAGGRKTFDFRALLLVLGTSLLLSRGLNLLLNLTALPRLFPGFLEATDGIYRCSFLSQMAASAISAPLLEEVLMRGLLYNRLKETLYSRRKALAGSALLFAVFHGNLVQGVYAFFLGLLFALIYESYQSLLPAVLAHMAANAASIFAQGLTLPESYFAQPLYLALTAVCLLYLGWLGLKKIISGF